MIAQNIYITTNLYVFIHIKEFHCYVLFFDIPHHTREELLMSSTWTSIKPLTWSPETFLLLHWRSMCLMY